MADLRSLMSSSGREKEHDGSQTGAATWPIMPRPPVNQPYRGGDIPIKLTPITGRVRAKEDVPVRVCDICKPRKTFTRAEHLRRHQLSHQTPAFRCTYPGCNLAYHRPDLLARHTQRHEHEDGPASAVRGLKFATTALAGTRPNPNVTAVVSRHLPLPALRIGIASVASDQATEDWTEDELREFLRDILKKQQGLEETVDEIIALLTKFELPGDLSAVQVGEKVLAEKSGRGFIMNKYFANIAKGSDAWTMADSGFGSLTYQSTDSSPLPAIVPTSPHGDIYRGPISPPDTIGTHDAGLRRMPLSSVPEMRNVSQGKTTTRPVDSPPVQQAPPVPFQALGNSVQMEDQILGGLKEPSEGIPNSNVRECLRNDPTESESTSEEEQTAGGEDTASHTTSTSGFDNFTTLLGNQSEELKARMVGFFERLIDVKLGLCHRQNAQQHPTSRGGEQNDGNSPPIHKPKTNTIEGTKQPKRSEEGDGDQGKSDEGEGGNPNRKRLKVEGNTPKQKIACPYIKRYPVQFAAWRTCVGPGFDGMHRMKEHLKRRHFKEHVCGRCGLQLQTNRLLQEHTRAPEPCDLRDIQPELGFMTRVQWDDIQGKARSHGASVGDKWKDIYIALFPDADETCIPGPYFDVTETSENLRGVIDPQEYERYLKQHLPKQILVKLNQEFQVLADHAKKRLLEIVEEESAETLKGYLLFKGLNPGPPPIACAGNMPSIVLPEVECVAPGWLNPGLLDDIDIFSYQAPFETGSAFSFTWRDENTKDQADSTYGSNIVDGGSTAGA